MISYFYKLSKYFTFYLFYLSRVKIFKEKMRQSFPASNRKSAKSHRVSLYCAVNDPLRDEVLHQRAAHPGGHQRLPGIVL